MRALLDARRAWVGLASPPSFSLEAGGCKGAVARAAAVLDRFYVIRDGIEEAYGIISLRIFDPTVSEELWLADAEADVARLSGRAEPRASRGNRFGSTHPSAAASSASSDTNLGYDAVAHGIGSAFLRDVQRLVDAGRKARDAVAGGAGRPGSVAASSFFLSLVQEFESKYEVELAPFDPTSSRVEEWANFLVTIADSAGQVVVNHLVGAGGTLTEAGAEGF